MFTCRTNSEGCVEKFESFQRNVRKCDTIIFRRIELRFVVFDSCKASIWIKTKNKGCKKVFFMLVLLRRTSFWPPSMVYTRISRIVILEILGSIFQSSLHILQIAIFHNNAVVSLLVKDIGVIVRCVILCTVYFFTDATALVKTDSKSLCNKNKQKN